MVCVLIPKYRLAHLVDKQYALPPLNRGIRRHPRVPVVMPEVVHRAGRQMFKPCARCFVWRGKTRGYSLVLYHYLHTPIALATFRRVVIGDWPRHAIANGAHSVRADAFVNKRRAHR